MAFKFFTEAALGADQVDCWPAADVTFTAQEHEGDTPYDREEPPESQRKRHMAGLTKVPQNVVPSPSVGKARAAQAQRTRVQVLPRLCIDGQIGALIIQGLPETEAFLKAMKSQIVLDITSVVTKYYEATHGGDVYIRPYVNEPAGVVVSIDGKLVVVLFQLSIGSALAAPHVRSQPTLLAHNSYVMAAVAEVVKALLRPDAPATRYEDSVFKPLGGPGGGEAFSEKARALGVNYLSPCQIGGIIQPMYLRMYVFMSVCAYVCAYVCMYVC